MSEIIVIAFGSNQGNRRNNIDRALELCAERCGEAAARSSMIETEPMLHPDNPEPQPHYLNCAAAFRTHLTPTEVLQVTARIETELGRVRTGKKWGARSIDIDVIAYGAQCVNLPEVTIPHPELHKREFVLIPMIEVAPDWVHPILKLTPAQMLERLRDQRKV